MGDPVLSTRSAAAGVAVLDPMRHAALVAALDAAVAEDPSLAAARAHLLAPLALLQALARDAEGALGDDVLAAERLRLLLSVAAAQMPPVSELRQVVGTGAKTAFASETAAPCADGVIQAGGLVIVALAAGRVGKAAGLAQPLLLNVLALAAAAAPAEALSRSLASGMEVWQVKALLTGLEGARDRRLSAAIATFLADPCEQARWRSLEVLFVQVNADVAETPWDAAGGGSIADVEPRDACPGQPVTLRLGPAVRDQSPAAMGAENGPALDSAHFLPLLALDAAEVVFAAPGHPALARLPESVDLQASTVTVLVPEGARAGWIGFADPTLLDESNRARTALREAWEERNGSMPALRDAPVPVASIPLLAAPPTPPRGPRVRFDGGSPVILDASLTPPVADPGAPMRLAWRVAGARGVFIHPDAIKVEHEGTLEVSAPLDRSRVAYEIVAQGGCGTEARRELTARVRVRIRQVDVTQPGRARGVGLKLIPPRAHGGLTVRGADLGVTPSVLAAGEEAEVAAVLSAADAPGTAELVVGDQAIAMEVDGARATATVPAALAVDGLTGTVVYRGPDGEIEDRAAFGPIQFVELRVRSLMVVRPAAIGEGLKRVSMDEVRAACREAEAGRALLVNLAEPAWTDDEDLWFDGAAEGEDVPVTRALLERLNVLAARCPGFEDHTWVAVVPAADEKSHFARVETADGARAVAVATPGALGELLEKEPGETQPRTARVRVVGTLDGDGSLKLQPLRAEVRAAGPGAPVDTGLRAVALDREGRVVASAPVKAMTADRPARAAVLLPVTDDVVAMELRGSARGPMEAFIAGGPAQRLVAGDTGIPVRRVDRPEGAPELIDVKVEEGTIRYEYGHSASARATVVMEIGGERGWSPVLRLHGCQISAEIPSTLARVSEGDFVRLAATDGWNVAYGPEGGLPLGAPRTRAVARHAGGLRFWADVDGEGEILWTFDEDKEARGPVVTVPAGVRVVKLTATADGGEPVEDTRRIGADGIVRGRSTVLPEEGRHG